MATSDLANELAKPSFRFDNDHTEDQVTTVVLQQLNDQSSDISSLATKCLGLLTNKVGNVRLNRIIKTLLDNMIEGKKEQQRDVAFLGLKTVITEVHPLKAKILADAATSRLQQGLRSPTPDIASNSLDALIEVASRHGTALTDLEGLRAALLPELDASRAGIRKRAIHCLALIASYFSPSQLDSLAEDLFSRLEQGGSGGGGGGSHADSALKQEQVKTYIQAIGALSKSIGFKLGGHMHRAIPLVLHHLAAAEGQEDEETMEFALVALESFVQRCPGDVRPFLDSLCSTACIKYIKYDPNYAMEEEMDDADGAGGRGMAMDDDEDEGDNEEDDDEFEEDVYSDDEDASWKVRRAAAKLTDAIITQYPDALAQTLYPRFAPVLVSRFKEREEAVCPDIYQAYNDLVRGMSVAGGQRGDATATSALASDIPSVMRSLSKRLHPKKSPKTRSFALRCLLELIRACPSQVIAGMGVAVPGVVSAIEDTTGAGGSGLRVVGLSCVNAALAAARPPQSFQPHTLALAPAVFGAADDRYYGVSSEALQACQSFIRIIRPVPAGPIAPELQCLVEGLFTVASGRLSAQDVSMEVKEAAISCAAAVVAELGDALEGENSISKVSGRFIYICFW